MVGPSSQKGHHNKNTHTHTWLYMTVLEAQLSLFLTIPHSAVMIPGTVFLHPTGLSLNVTGCGSTVSSSNLTCQLH